MNTDTLLYFSEIAVLAFGGLTIAINTIAAVTPNDTDNKWAARLTWVNNKLQMFALPFLRAKRVNKE